MGIFLAFVLLAQSFGGFFPSYPIPVPAVQGGVDSLTPIKSATTGITKVIAFGDSITVGGANTSCASGAGTLHTPTGTCYLDLLGIFYGAQVANLGINGTCLENVGTYCLSASSGFSRYTNANTAGNPGFTGLIDTTGKSLYVIWYGINDVIHADVGANPSTFKTQYNTIGAYLITQGVPWNRIVIVSLPPNNYGIMQGGNGIEMYAYLAQATAGVAAINQVLYADVFNSLSPCWPGVTIVIGTQCSSDGLHPNDTGAVIAASEIEMANYQSAIGAKQAFTSLAAAWGMPGAFTQFPNPITMSGANLATGTIPDAALVTAPVTSVSGSGNTSSTGGTTPTVTVTNAPTFSGTVATTAAGGTAGFKAGVAGTESNYGLEISNNSANAGSNKFTRWAVSASTNVNGVPCEMYCILDDGAVFLSSVDHSGNQAIAGGVAMGGSSVLAYPWHPASDPQCTVSAGGTSCNTTITVPKSSMRCTANDEGTALGGIGYSIAVSAPSGTTVTITYGAVGVIAGGGTATFSVVCT